MSDRSQDNVDQSRLEVNGGDDDVKRLPEGEAYFLDFIAETAVMAWLNRPAVNDNEPDR